MVHGPELHWQRRRMPSPPTLLRQLLLVMMIIVSYWLPRCDGLLLKVGVNGRECISEDAGSEKVLIHLRYNVTSRPSDSAEVDLVVRSAKPPPLPPPPPLLPTVLTAATAVPPHRPITARPPPLPFAQVKSRPDVARGGSAPPREWQLLKEDKGISAGSATFVSDGAEEFSVCFVGRCPDRVFGLVDVEFDLRSGYSRALLFLPSPFPLPCIGDGPAIDQPV
jgi:hypothetical protein